jgi:hypothetical protein
VRVLANQEQGVGRGLKATDARAQAWQLEGGGMCWVLERLKQMVVGDVSDVL